MPPSQQADLTAISLRALAALINAPNIVVLVMLLAFIVYTFCLLNSTKEERRVSDWLNARADARDYMIRQYRYYRGLRTLTEERTKRREEAFMERSANCQGCQHLKTDHGVLGCAVCSRCKMTYSDGESDVDPRSDFEVSQRRQELGG